MFFGIKKLKKKEIMLHVLMSVNRWLLLFYYQRAKLPKHAPKNKIYISFHHVI